MQRREQSHAWLSLLPLVAGLLFAALMLYFAMILTEQARKHHRAKKLTENAQRIGRSSVTPGGLRSDSSSTLSSAPVKKKHWFVEYEIKMPLLAVPLIVVGLLFARMTFGQLPPRNPFALSDTLRRSLSAMICLLVLSPGCLLLYLWLLRIGLIG